MIYSDSDIRKAIRNKTIRIDPFDQKRLQPCSYDVTLGPKFKTLPEGTIIDPSYPPEPDEYEDHEGQFMLAPQSIVLASTAETLLLTEQTTARLEGKSSLARLGVGVHTTAGFIDPGFYGQITLEIFNQSMNWITLIPGKAVGQLVFESLASKPVYDYKVTGRYQNQEGPTISKGIH